MWAIWQDLLGAAFNLKKGEISGPLNLGQKGAVVQILERVEPSTSDPAFASDRDELRDQLAEKKREQALQLYLGGLGTRMEKEGKVKINQAEMKNLVQGPRLICIKRQVCRSNAPREFFSIQLRLPSLGGIGDLGPEAYAFADFLFQSRAWGCGRYCRCHRRVWGTLRIPLFLPLPAIRS